MIFDLAGREIAHAGEEGHSRMPCPGHVERDLGDGAVNLQLSYHLRYPELSWLALSLTNVQSSQLLAPWTDGKVEGLLSGRIRSDCIGFIQSAINHGSTRKILDLTEVTLVDLTTIRYLIRCEHHGVELVQCLPYIREWILRERAESAPPAPDVNPGALRESP